MTDTGIDFEPIVGRYISLAIAGRNCRIYVEQAGSGIPLLCLHTAGADTRQFRYMMADTQITSRYRVIAFDLPWHGKSYPPDGALEEEYRLSTDLYAETILAVCDGLQLHRPVLLGCSIGGRIVLKMANDHASRFSAFIGLESADFQKPWYDTAWLHRSDVHGGEVCAALISGLIAPQVPQRNREEILWQYMQSGPGVFRGDLYFYRVDADLRGKLGNIDCPTTPLYLLTGEYDFSCMASDTLRTAESIPGARVQIMKGLGHFPMSEDHDRFRACLLPVLDEIAHAHSCGR
jgi:pimeloyl-ACP methyl ester carboxylesterase